MPWGLGIRLERKLLTSNLQEANDHQANIWYVPKPMFQQMGHTNRPFVVGPDFTRRVVKYERFIRPMGLRYKKAHVTHPELKGKLQITGNRESFLLPFKSQSDIGFPAALIRSKGLLTRRTPIVTVQLPIISVKKVIDQHLPSIYLQRC